MARIVLTNVAKIFPDGTEAVRDAGFTIEDGEFFILVGPSGCGKSTLLNMIAGLEDVSEGEIRVDDQLFNDLDPKDRNMAMVFQSYALYPHMSVWENMAFPLKMAGAPKQEINRRVEAAAKMLELRPLLARKPGRLSGGQRQRVAMGRAIVRQPVAFLLDEPLSNLDARLRVQMRTEIARLQRRLGTTTVYVTHDQTEAMTLGDRVAVLKEGVIQQIGTPFELYTHPRNLFVAGFIGSPTMNFLPARVKGRGLMLPLLNREIELPGKMTLPPGTDHLIAGIRPEYFHRSGESGDSAAPEAAFDISVEVVEWLGAELLIHFQTDAGRGPDLPALAEDPGGGQKGSSRDLVARLDAASPVREDETIRLGLDPNKLHLFDPNSGECLTSPPEKQGGRRLRDRDLAPSP